MADAADSKSADHKSCGFKSHQPHQIAKHLCLLESSGLRPCGGRFAKVFLLILAEQAFCLKIPGIYILLLLGGKLIDADPLCIKENLGHAVVNLFGSLVNLLFE